jgi:Methane oxygenase PmoA
MQRAAILCAVAALVVLPGVNVLPRLETISSAIPSARVADARAFEAVALTVNESARRVDVTVGGKPFTSYIWPERVKKPVLDPIRAASGTIVTRGWPLNPRPGERVDHPHHVGLWLNHESVNGVDFWNNSDELKPRAAEKMGTILHRAIVGAPKNGDHGELVTELDWNVPGGKTILRERAQFVFSGDATSRTIERTSTLTALDTRVVFADAKDGMLGMRVARQLEQPSNEPQVFTDISGRATPVPVMDNSGVTGEYTSSEGKKGDAVWATRGRWTMLSGTIGNEPVTIAIVDHPTNPGYPTYWHARGYGLFAANPLGQKIFSNGRESLNLTLEPRASVTFRYRVVVLQGKAAPERIEREFRDFAGGQSSR